MDKVHLLPCLYLPWESSIWGIGIALKTGRYLCLIISEDADKSLKDAREQQGNLLGKTGITLNPFWD